MSTPRTMSPAAPPGPTGTGPSARRRARRHDPAETRAAYLFLLPWLLGLAAFTLGPILISFWLSFTDYNLLSPPEWIGLDNYRRMLDDPRLQSSLEVTALFVLVSVPGILVFSLAMAMLLNRGSALLPVYRVLIYLPSLMGTSVAVAIMWRQVFGREGAVNAIVSQFGMPVRSWVGTPDLAPYTLIILAIWTFGSTMVIFLAGLRQIPAELYEAAEIDGANAWSRFWSITFPSLSPVTFFNTIMVTVHCFQTFTPAYILSEGTGGPADATLLYALYLYEMGFKVFQMGYASALAWLMLAALAVFTGLFFLSSRYWVHYNER